MERSVSPVSDSDVPFKVSDTLAPPRVNKIAGTTTINFDGLLTDPLLLKEDLKNGCGGQLWPAGMVLSRYLLSQHTSDMSGKTIVEIGAGGGLVGLAVARGCQFASPIHITDQLPMFDLMQDNILLNQLGTKVKASILDWGEQLPTHIPNHPDIILAADCVYFEPAFPLLLSTLKDLIGPETVCYFCYKRRRRADLRFIKLAKKNFDMQEIRDDPNATSYNRENIFLYTLRRKTPKSNNN